MTDCCPQVPYRFAKRDQAFIERHSGVIVYRQGVDPCILADLQRFYPQHTGFEKLTEEDFVTRLKQCYEEVQHAIADLQADHMIGEDNLEDLANAVDETKDLLDQDMQAPVVRLLNALLQNAISAGASDLHIETFEKRLLIRHRVDGILQDVLEPKRALAAMLTSRIKVMAKLDIAEKRLPQDGRIALKLGQRDIDVRVSTLPSNHGERIVMRLLYKSENQLSLPSLGMAEHSLQTLQQQLKKPHGIILVTGPTGSGKTTSLYASLSHINNGRKNILTIEDPVEYDLDGIGQTQVNNVTGLTFSTGLRAILRQDPDVVMIGEIRDFETAQIAIQASLTGHLVLSTLHTNTAVGAVTRLADMGIEPFLLSSSVSAVMAQRLVRQLCDHCKVPTEVSDSDLDASTMAYLNQLAKQKQQHTVTIYHPDGCEHCQYQGYSGRTGIYELIDIDQRLRDHIHQGDGEALLTEAARELSPSLYQDGLRLVHAGTTSMEEVLRVTREALEN